MLFRSLNKEGMIRVKNGARYGNVMPYQACLLYTSYGFFESFPAGIKYGWNVLAGYVGDMKYVFSKEGAKSLGANVKRAL